MDSSTHTKVDLTKGGSSPGNSRLKAVRDSADGILDAAGRPFAPMASRWKRAADARSALRTPEAREAVRAAVLVHRATMADLRRDRRAFERARGEVAWWNVVNGERRAARAVVRDSRRIAREAASARRAARAAHPVTLTWLAARCHAAHLLPTGLWMAVSDSVAATGAFGLSATAVALNATGVALGMRCINADATTVADAATTVAADVSQPLQPSRPEAGLLQRLGRDEWPLAAEPRGLGGVLSGGGTLTGAGITADLTLEGQMTLQRLRAMEPQLRAALRLAEGVRLELREGRTGGHARLTLRTRSAADSIDMAGWAPGDAWAVDTVTGETVPVPLGKRILFAGASGSGKSWSARPLMAEASERPDHRLVVFDRKYIEGLNWSHRARVVSELDDMRELCEELTAEGESRLKSIPRGSDTVEISVSRPRITVFVDEGGELISDSRTKHPKDEEDRTDYGDIMSTLRTVARKYRAAEIILVWCTQKPALSGEGHGLDSQIAGQLMHRLSLALATATDTQVVFGSDAIEKGWKANELPMPGFALFRNQELGPRSAPHVLRMRAMSAKDVIALPDRPVWSRSTSSTGVTARDIAARKAVEGPVLPPAGAAADPWSKLLPPVGGGAEGRLGDADTVDLSGGGRVTRVTAVDRDDQVMAALRTVQGGTLSELSRTLGLHKQVVKRSLDRLAMDGLAYRGDGDLWRPTA